jgi:hypothetical protein
MLKLGVGALKPYKVEAFIPVKISSCSCLETRSPLTKNYTNKVKLKRSTKLIFLKFSYKELNMFCNFKVKYCRPLFVTSRGS